MHDPNSFPLTQNLPFLPTGLLFDLDETLFTKERSIPTEMLSLINQLRAAGLKIGLATGREFAFLNQFVLPLFAPDDLHITSGGAELINGQGEIIFSRHLSSDLVHTLYDSLLPTHIRIIFGQREKMFTTHPKDLDPKFQALDLVVDLAHTDILDWSTGLITIADFSPPAEKILQHLLSDPAFANQILIKKQFHRVHHANIFHQYYYNFTPTGVNKGTTAEVWAEHNHLNLNQVISFGDNANDIEVLQKVGWGVAMHHGTPEAKAASKQVIGGVDTPDFANFLREILARLALAPQI